MRFSQSRISWTVSTKHPLPVPDHFWPANLHCHQLHGGASSVQVSARLSDIKLSKPHTRNAPTTSYISFLSPTIQKYILSVMRTKHAFYYLFNFINVALNCGSLYKNTIQKCCIYTCLITYIRK